MKNIIKKTILLILLIVLFVSLYTLNENTKKPSYKYLRSVSVLIKVDNKKTGDRWSGSGVIVKQTNDFTYILTNRHVAPFSQDKSVYVYNGVEDWKPAVVLKNSVGESLDMSLIRIQGKLTNKMSVKGIKTAKIQDRTYMAGCYGGRLYFYREGVISSEIAESYYIETVIMGGDSGSGVINKNGYLIAINYALELDYGYIILWDKMVTAVLAPNHSMALAITGQEILKFLKGEI